MRRIAFTLPLVLAACRLVSAADEAPAPAEQPDEEGFVSLFNGTDLSGWEGDLRFWSVEDGAITGRTTADNRATGNTFLVWSGGEVADFELRLTCRIVGNNSGIQYRSKLVDPDKFVVHGYQADFGPGESHNGKLYDEGGDRASIAYPGQKVVVDKDGKKQVTPLGDEAWRAKIKAGIPENEWVEFTIIAEGSHLVHKINGEVMIDAVDEEEGKRFASGIIALQIHGGDPMKVQFKDIRLKREDVKREPGE